MVSPFALIGQKIGVQDADRLMGIDGRPLSIDAPARAAVLSRPDGIPVILTLRHGDGSLSQARVIRSGAYERAEFAGSHLNVGTRRLASFLFDLLSRLVGLGAAFVLFLRRPPDPVAMLFFVAMLLNGFPVATSSTMWPGLGGVLVVATAQFSLVLTSLLFPHGRMRTPWHWLALGIACVTWYKDFATNMGYWTPIAIVAQYRLTHEGVERQQVKPIAFSTGVWIAFYVRPLPSFPGIWRHALPARAPAHG